ncbi:AraC family transcriptional regulator ligand-binding domain-containing protein [Neiella sp. HB171785]|uniref:AraC family transcriptional regulator ligand-binding domain-containing protein n=1 Tax=Neiella litorisoli TaxID=2771431 RepID=A0A8J6QI98_9GAMM|nr:AraC family transcriptional regulator [Neiella litorisoli]MBD1389123.1 AraC family transcriptional regulator ligand-binding domain-containing protein [Neiella litorisoli]
MADIDQRTSWGIHAEWLVAYLIQEGVSLSEISAIVGEKISNPDRVYLQIDDYLGLLGWSAKRLSSPHLGMDMAEQATAETFGTLGYLIKNSPNIAVFCEMLEQYQVILMTGMKFSFREIGGLFEVQWQIFRPPSESTRQDVEFSLAAFLNVSRDALGKPFNPKKVSFEHECQLPLKRYEDTFGTNIAFSQQRNSLYFNVEMLDTPLASRDLKLLDIVKSYADSKLSKWQLCDNLIEQAKFIISISLETEGAGVDSVAQSLHVTARTLNRHLRKNGTNYKTIREEVIVALAKQALRESNSSITAIGSKLGYSESSSFVRAFKRLTGTTPVLFRKLSLDKSTQFSQTSSTK